MSKKEPDAYMDQEVRVKMPAAARREVVAAARDAEMSFMKWARRAMIAALPAGAARERAAEAVRRAEQPGKIERTLEWLAEHPGSTAAEAARALGASQKESLRHLYYARKRGLALSQTTFEGNTKTVRWTRTNKNRSDDDE